MNQKIQDGDFEVEMVSGWKTAMYCPPPSTRKKHLPCPPHTLAHPGSRVAVLSQACSVDGTTKGLHTSFDEDSDGSDYVVTIPEIKNKPTANNWLIHHSFKESPCINCVRTHHGYLRFY